ncbi:HAD family hydrolase [Pseudonocardia nigra]|uniref:HAD family hydrolase n=1 Tax=Pseudonocardia nigra TaxID=1921578 RepID=UPI001FE83237|nr:HAD family phosphatase [Pseudonocardia nigra]
MHAPSVDPILAHSAVTFRGTRFVPDCGLRRPEEAPLIEAVVFDIGGVLVDVDFRRLYRDLLDEARIDWFLGSVVTRDWHRRHDAGYPMHQGVADLIAEHPDHAELIAAWDDRFPDVWVGAQDDTVAIAMTLRARGLPLYLLSNWPGEKFPLARERFPFLDELFDGQVISGYEGVVKPDARIFEVLAQRYGLVPSRTVFVDDMPANASTARDLGYRAIEFIGADRLRAELGELGLVV